MPIIRQDVVDGPNIQKTGQHRGVIEFEFDDGRIIRKRLMAPDSTAWNNLLIDIGSQVELRMQELDAEEFSKTDQDIVDYKQATNKQVAVAYLRKAYSTGYPLKAYNMFERFDTYRQNQGWNVNQVATALINEGLEQEEWDLMVERYNYLKVPSRVTDMEAYENVLIGDTWGTKFRQDTSF